MFDVGNFDKCAKGDNFFPSYLREVLNAVLENPETCHQRLMNALTLKLSTNDKKRLKTWMEQNPEFKDLAKYIIIAVVVCAKATVSV